MALLKSLKRRVSLAAQLSVFDWLILGKAWLALPAFYFSLRRKSYEELVSARIFDRQEQNIKHDPNILYQLVLWASYLHVLPMSCLPRALTLHWLLRQNGFDSALKIGAQKKDATLHVHAWVEVDGQPIGEDMAAFEELVHAVR